MQSNLCITVNESHTKKQIVTTMGDYVIKRHVKFIIF